MSFFEKIKKIASEAGPGVITGAADDDPSGILTYLQSGVVLGARILWIALFTIPLMYYIQEMCARIGYVSGKGIMRLIKERYSRPALYFIASVSLAVITINIGADLLAVATIFQEYVPFSVPVWLVLSAALVLFFVVFLSYKKFAEVMKWLTLSLLFYVATVFFMHLSWGQALFSTFLPSFSFTKNSIVLLAAILGTTISPYLFFWQANEEIEERDELIEEKHLKRFVITKNELKTMRKDVFSGMFYSNVVMWFMIAGASAIGATGTARIATFQEASQVLRPLLGDAAYAVFGIGIIGTGFLAIPILAGSIGYILAELFGWSEGIDKKFHEARGFYLSIALATLGGLVINLFRVDPVQLLIYTAVLYTVITPPLLYSIIRIGSSREIMKHKTNSKISNFFGWLTFGVMTACAAAYLLSFRS